LARIEKYHQGVRRAISDVDELAGGRDSAALAENITDASLSHIGQPKFKRIGRRRRNLGLLMGYSLRLGVSVFYEFSLATDDFKVNKCYLV